MPLVETLKKQWWIVAGGVVVVAAAATLLTVTIVSQNSDGNTATAVDDGLNLPNYEEIISGEGDGQTRAPTTDTVDIGSTEEMLYDAIWNPPDDGEGFWQIVDEVNGYPEDGGTDYVIAHSCKSGDCAGDPVKKLAMGDIFKYRGIPFVVLTTMKTERNAIGGMDLWQHQPDRLILITCALDTGSGELDSNFIVIAQPAA